MFYCLGPVRGIAFHQTQPLFVSGGDDYKIKVWNYKQRKCLFTLTGHLDYIRTVFFHHEYPWIISASDDQTIRIWNWQNRHCVSILTGHNHYVMCAQFHPKEDLVVSASLDQTVRVWDISGLRKKNTSAPVNRFNDDRPAFQNNQADIFGNTDVLVKYVLEGHDRGVNWASFHPTLPLIVSGADDRQVKLWRMSDTKAWEVDTCRGHYNNVSSVLFHPKQELIISNSEDKTIRVWDMNKRVAIQNFRRENDRFWILVAHPERNLFAAGHDNGMIVFKFERERPAFAVHQNSVFYVKDWFIRHFDLSTGTDSSVIGIRKSSGLNNQPRTLSYNAAENAVILSSPVDGGIFEVYQLPKDFTGVSAGPDKSNDCKRGVASSAIFVARSRYVTFNKTTQTLEVRNLNNDSSKSVVLNKNVTDVFPASTAQILLITPVSVILYDIQEQKEIVELSVANVKYVYWSNTMNFVALVAKHSIVIASKKLEQLCNIHETIRLKGGVWDDSDVFIYSTLNHIKFALPQGDSGIIKTVEEPLYLLKYIGKNLYCLDRDCKLRVLDIDPTEFRFKQALLKKRFDEVMLIIQNSSLVGQSIISYLMKKGYPEVALQFVRDPRSRFDLALECGNLDIALDMAKTIDQEDCWAVLSDVALRQGNVQIVEISLQRIKNFEKLSFLYLINASNEKLSKMVKIAELRGDRFAQFQNAMFMADAEEQIGILNASGMHSLACVFAAKNGIISQVEDILSKTGKTEQDLISRGPGILLKPLTPVSGCGLVDLKDCNWPLLPISGGFLEHTPAGELLADMGTEVEAKESSSENKQTINTEEVEASWGIDDELDVTISEANEEYVEAGETSGQLILPPMGPSAPEFWIRNSSLAVDHVAAGSFETAMQLLNRQVGAIKFDALKKHFLLIYQSVRCHIPMLSSIAQSSVVPLNRNWQSEIRDALPLISYKLSMINSDLETALASTTSGQFQVAILQFTEIISCCLLSIASNSNESKDIQKVIESCREYIVGLSMELKRRELEDSPLGQKRAIELAAYFTHCKLNSIHQILSLRLAMNLSYKLKCHQTTSIFVRRLLELKPTETIAATARKLQSVVEHAMKDEIQLDYNPISPFWICAKSFKPLYDINKISNCSLCGASFSSKYTGSVCTVCNISEIGSSGTGIKLTQ